MKKLVDKIKDKVGDKNEPEAKSLLKPQNLAPAMKKQVSFHEEVKVVSKPTRSQSPVARSQQKRG